ncbi:DUF885 domain-containing protein [Brevundimonas lenta]|uniref:Uncharacterized protein (DUF885 family) n=1 Tax=Brevundimonas lenta TaxID=424796 RepID=A0A7W6JH47_9CAUL|nr:DUF885 family protein [Brevundimonas lenta]MBB4084073.1 uncharacterized protein (DUF885 family) [Brevundimonas lenta]
MIDRRRLLASAAGGLSLVALPAFARVPVQNSAARIQARALYDTIFEATLQASPVNATGLGLDVGAHADLKSRIDSRAYADRLNMFKPMAAARPALAAVDASGLAGRDRSDYDTVVWMADRAAEIDAFPFGGVDSYGYPCPYVVSQLTGLYQSVPDFLDSQHTVANVADAEAYLSRLESFAEGMNHETARVAKDADEHGLVPPDFIIDKTLVQLRALRAQSGESAGLVQSLVKKTAEAGVQGDWGKRAAALVDGPVAAALDAQIAQMERLRPLASHDAGIGTRPNGVAYYDLCLRFQTSTGLSPQQAHQVGLDQVAQIEALADPLLRQRGYTEGSVGARLTAFGKDPQYLYPNTDDGRNALLADLNHQVAAIEARLPDVFERLPRARVEVRRVPVSIELGAPRGYAQSPSLDGSRPGAYYINLVDTAIWPKWALPTLTYHESLPGHHLQGALALEATDTPLLLKSLGFNAYGEGWGLYAEQLAEEVGMYDDFTEGRLGYHQSFLYRAARIVIDTGIHSMGWSREQAIRYMVDTVGLAPGAAESEIERYCVWPGQACGYKIGHTEIDRLRTVAKERTGDRFDIKSFHSAILDGGAMPLEVLGRVVDQWTAARLA